MVRRTQSMMVMPWKGGLVTSVNEALIAPTQLTIADNISLAYSDEKRRREGINYNWDDVVFEVDSRESAAFSPGSGGGAGGTGRITVREYYQ